MFCVSVFYAKEITNYRIPDSNGFSQFFILGVHFSAVELAHLDSTLEDIPTKLLFYAYL